MWCHVHSDGPTARPDRRPVSSRGRHAQASRKRLARRRRGTRPIDGGLRTNRAGSPCPSALRTRTSSPRPATASAGVRRTVHHASASRPSLSPGAVGAQPPTPAATRPAVSSFGDRPSGSRSSVCLLPFSFLLCFLKTIRSEKFSELADEHRQNSSRGCSAGDHYCCACDACWTHMSLH